MHIYSQIIHCIFTAVYVGCHRWHSKDIKFISISSRETLYRLLPFMDILHKPSNFHLIWPRKPTLLFARNGLITLKTVPHLSSNPYLAENRRHKSYRRRLRPFPVLSAICLTVLGGDIFHIHHMLFRFQPTVFALDFVVQKEYNVLVRPVVVAHLHCTEIYTVLRGNGNCVN